MSFSPCVEPLGGPRKASESFLNLEFFRDPVFLIGTFLLALNCLVFRKYFSHQAPFFSAYWNDTLLIPVALPPVLWLQTMAKSRPISSIPSTGEILFHLTLWSLLLEGIFPKIFHHGTSDPWDVLAYAAGAFVAGCFWKIKTAGPGRK